MVHHYSSGKEIIEKYDPMYKPVFDSVGLFHIFNDEHDYDMTDTEFANELIMLTMGHYFSLEEDDINKAKYYYSKVTDLNSAYGLYSLGVFFYTKKMFPRARLYATNGLGLETKGSSDCVKLLHKISLAEKDFDKAEKYLLDEIERLNNSSKTNLTNDDLAKNDLTKTNLIETLCFFHLNVTKNGEKLIEFTKKYLSDSYRIRCIVAMHYYNAGDVNNLIQHAELMMVNKLIIGNYFMGLHSYLQFALICKNNGLNISNIEEATELLEIAETWFSTIEMSDEIKELKNHAVGMINKVNIWKQEIEKTLISNNQMILVV